MLNLQKKKIYLEKNVHFFEYLNIRVWPTLAVLLLTEPQIYNFQSARQRSVTVCFSLTPLLRGFSDDFPFKNSISLTFTLGNRNKKHTKKSQQET